MDPRIRLIEELRDEMDHTPHHQPPCFECGFADRLDAILSTPVSESVSREDVEGVPDPAMPRPLSDTGNHGAPSASPDGRMRDEEKYKALLETMDAPALRREALERMRVNVGIIAENRSLKRVEAPDQSVPGENPWPRRAYGAGASASPHVHGYDANGVPCRHADHLLGGGSMPSSQAEAEIPRISEADGRHESITDYVREVASASPDGYVSEIEKVKSRLWRGPHESYVAFAMRVKADLDSLIAKAGEPESVSPLMEAARALADKVAEREPYWFTGTDLGRYYAAEVPIEFVDAVRRALSQVSESKE